MLFLKKVILKGGGTSMSNRIKPKKVKVKKEKTGKPNSHGSGKIGSGKIGGGLNQNSPARKVQKNRKF